MKPLIHSTVIVCQSTCVSGWVGPSLHLHEVSTSHPLPQAISDNSSINLYQLMGGPSSALPEPASFPAKACCRLLQHRRRNQLCQLHSPGPLPAYPLLYLTCHPHAMQSRCKCPVAHP